MFKYGDFDFSTCTKDELHSKLQNKTDREFIIFANQNLQKLTWLNLSDDVYNYEYGIAKSPIVICKLMIAFLVCTPFDIDVYRLISFRLRDLVYNNSMDKVFLSELMLYCGQRSVDDEHMSETLKDIIETAVINSGINCYSNMLIEMYVLGAIKSNVLSVIKKHIRANTFVYDTALNVKSVVNYETLAYLKSIGKMIKYAEFNVGYHGTTDAVRKLKELGYDNISELIHGYIAGDHLDTLKTLSIDGQPAPFKFTLLDRNYAFMSGAVKVFNHCESLRHSKIIPCIINCGSLLVSYIVSDNVETSDTRLTFNRQYIVQSALKHNTVAEIQWLYEVGGYVFDDECTRMIEMSDRYTQPIGHDIIRYLYAANVIKANKRNTVELPHNLPHDIVQMVVDKGFLVSRWTVSRFVHYGNYEALVIMKSKGMISKESISDMAELGCYADLV